MSEDMATPILRLHDELFYLIFQYLSAIYPPGKTNKLGWISATHVCKLWRRIAIDDCATLWDECLCAFPKAFPIFLERARDAKLTIELTETEYGMNHRPGRPLKQPIWLQSYDLTDALVSVFQTCSQQIQRVTFLFPAFRPRHSPFPAAVSNFDDNSEDNTLAAHNALIIEAGEWASQLSSAALSGLMGQTLPHLQELELLYDNNIGPCPVISTELSDCNAFSAPSLTSLKLWRQRIPLETLYAILGETPILETLEVQWTAEDGEAMLDHVPSLSKSLTLPHLKNISLDSPTTSLQSLYSLLNPLRPHVDVRLVFVGAVASQQEASDFIAVIEPQLKRQSIDSLTMYWGDVARGTGLAFSSSSSTYFNPKPCVDIKFSVPVPPGFFPALVEQTFTPADYARTRVLNLDIAFGLAIEHFSLFTGLEEICVVMDPDGALAELTRLSHATPALFPALKTLVLKHINISAFSTWRGEGRNAANEFLRTRQELGIPVSRVIVRGMTLGPDFSFDGVRDDVALAELEKYVDEVIDQRRDHSEGILEIMAIENFL